MLYLCVFACVTAVTDFPAEIVVKVADVTVVWAAPWMNKDPKRSKKPVIDDTVDRKAIFPACVPGNAAIVVRMSQDTECVVTLTGTLRTLGCTVEVTVCLFKQSVSEEGKD